MTIFMSVNSTTKFINAPNEIWRPRNSELKPKPLIGYLRLKSVFGSISISQSSGIYNSAPNFPSKTNWKIIETSQILLNEQRVLEPNVNAHQTPAEIPLSWSSSNVGLSISKSQWNGNVNEAFVFLIRMEFKSIAWESVESSRTNSVIIEKILTLVEL